MVTVFKNTLLKWLGRVWPHGRQWWALPLLLLLGPAAWAASDTRPVLLVLGDSLSAGYGLSPGQGWVDLLETKLQRKMKVVNASVSGETSAWGVSTLPDLLQQHHPKVVVIELGANDGLRGLPTTALEQNLRAMISMAQQAQAQVLLIGIELPINYGGPYRRAFRTAYQQSAEQTKVKLVPMLFEPIALKRQFYQADGLHPTAAAQPLLLEHVWDTLEGVIPRALRP